MKLYRSEEWASMKRFKRVLCCLAVVMAVPMLIAAEPTISLTATPRYPWNGLVDLAFTIEGDEGAKYDTMFSVQDVVGGTNLSMKTVYKSPGVKANAGVEKLVPGSYNWLWDAPADVGNDFVSESVVIDAKVGDAITYSVKFNANGGTGSMANETFESGVAKALTANAFKRTGYLFNGWATNATGSIVYSDQQSVADLTTTADGVVDLYALWKNNSYSVKFNANGGTGTMSNEAMEIGVAKALTANAFTRTGYTFQGWATTSSGSVKYTNKQSVQNLTTTVGGVVNLYAIWKVNTYTVQFNANGGSGTMKAQTFTYGKAQNLRANAFYNSNPNVAFLGWSTKKQSPGYAGTGGVNCEYVDRQSVKNLTKTNGGVVTLYAVWYYYF